MANLNLTHSGNMNINSASINSQGQIEVDYAPNKTGKVTGWTVSPEKGGRYEPGETLTVRFTPQFSGTVLTETFTVSGVDIAGVQRSDTATLRQDYNRDLTTYDVRTEYSRVLTINSSSVTENYVEYNVTMPSVTAETSVLLLVFSGIAGKPWNAYVEPTPGPDTGSTTASTLNIVVADSITGTGRASATYAPSSAVVSLRYESNSPAYATIDPITGEITVLQTGDVRFFVFDDVTGLFDSKVVHCYKDGDEPIDTGTVIDSLTILVGAQIIGSGYATSRYTPENAEVDLHYTSNLPSVASIDETTGLVTVHSTGNVTLCVRDTKSGLSDCKSVNVLTPEPGIIPATALTINVADTITDSGVATATYEPANADVSLYYSYEDTDIIGANRAGIDRYTGQISVRSTGTARFCVEDQQTGLKACKVVNVIKSDTPDTGDTPTYVSYVTLDVASRIINSGTASASYFPPDATVNLVYSSSDPTIATINSSTGDITVLQSGEVTICVTDTYTNQSDCKTVKMVYREYVSSLTLNVDDVIVGSGTASVTYSPSTADAWFIFSSSNDNVATIDPDTGEITVLRDGFVTICAVEAYSGLRDCKEITVYMEQAEEITGNTEGLKIIMDYTVTSTTEPTYIRYVNVDSQILDASLVDGSVVPMTSPYNNYYKFQQTGKQSVVYTIKGTAETLDFDNGNNYAGFDLQEGITSFAAFWNTQVNYDVVFPNSINRIGGFVNSGGYPNLVQFGDNYSGETYGSSSNDTYYYYLHPSTVVIGKDMVNMPHFFWDNVDTIVFKPTTQPSLNYAATLENFKERGIMYLPCGSDYSEFVSYLPPHWKITCYDDTLATSITVTGLTSIENYGYVKTNYFPYYADVDIEYSSSNENIAVVDENGAITATGDGVVSICARDKNSGLESCMSINVTRKRYVIVADYFVQDNSEPTTILSNLYGITKIQCGGRNIPVDTEYYFPTTGTNRLWITTTRKVVDNFQECSDLCTVSIPNGIQSIGANCFYNCAALSSVTLPNSILHIELRAFYWTRSLKSISLPGGLKTLATGSFEESGLVSITIPSTVEKIGGVAVWGCPLTEIYMESTVPPAIQSSSLLNSTCPIYVPCESLQDYRREYYNYSATYSRLTCESSPDTGETGTTLQIAEVTYNVTTTGNTLLFYFGYGNFNGTITRAYYKDGDNEIDITLTADGYGRRYYSFPETGLITVYYELEENSTSLGGISFTDSNNSNNKAPISVMRLPKGITTLPYGLSGTSIQSISGDDVTTTVDVPFAKCTSLSSVDLPKLTDIPASGFSGCTALTSFTIPASLETIGEYAFAKSGLTSITIPNTLFSLGKYCFASCTTMNSAEIHFGTIPQAAFSRCTRLTNVTLGEEVTRINDYAFAINTSLSSVKCYASSAPYIAITNSQHIAFTGLPQSGVLYYPSNGTGYSDGSAWLGSTRPYSFAYYGWTGSPTL